MRFTELPLAAQTAYAELAEQARSLELSNALAGLEVDFHARFREGGEELIQVCVGLDDAATLARELPAIDDAKVEHPRAKVRLLTLDQAPAKLPKGVIAQPAWQWLLA